MKSKISLLIILASFATHAFAANNVNLTGLAQANFKIFAEDLGSALSYKPITPPTPLGITGFDLGIEATSTEMRNLDIVTNSSLKNLIVPKLHVYKGLPLNIDIGAFYAAVPTTNIKLYGAELRYAIMEGGVALPAVGVRAAMTKLSGVDQMSFSSKSLDVSISKGFAIFTPYAGIGSVWSVSTPNNIAGLTEESFRQNKVFVGANLNFGLTNIALEYDKTGPAKSYGAKLGFRF